MGLPWQMTVRRFFRTIGHLGANLVGESQMTAGLLASTPLAAEIAGEAIVTASLDVFAPPPDEFLESLVGWNDAQDQDTVTVNGSDRVTLWEDKTVNDVNYLNYSAVTSPLYSLVGLNGRPGMIFAGLNLLNSNRDYLPFDPGWQYSGPLIGAIACGMNGQLAFGDTETVFQTAGVGIRLQIGDGVFKTNPSGGGTTVPVLTSALSTLSANWKITNPYDFTNIVILMSACSGYGSGEGVLRVRMWSAKTSTKPGFFMDTVIAGNGWSTSLFSNDASSPRLYHEFGSSTLADPGFKLGEFFLAIDDVTGAEARQRAVQAMTYLTDRWLAEDLLPLVLCVGDSLTKGFNEALADTYPLRMGDALAGVADVVNVGINSRTIGQLATDSGAQAAWIRPQTNVLVLWAGTNDIDAGTSAATAWAALQTLAQAFQTQGYLVILCDCIPRSTFSGAKNTQRNSFNALISDGWATCADGLVQLTANLHFNSNTSYTDETYYLPDGVHLTATGYQLISDLVQPEVQELLP